MTRVVIAGAGIGGLTAALALADAGLDVAVFERAPVLREIGAGLQLSPNATRVLRRVGILDRVRDIATGPDVIRIRRGRDGGDLARIPLGSVVEARFGAPFVLIHRADLQAALLEAARARASIAIATGEGVTGFSLDRDQVAVEVRSGSDTRTILAQGLVGADGLRSAVRALRHPGRPDDRIFCGRTAWRTMVDAARAPPAALIPDSNLWLGHRAHLVHYPLRKASLINIVAIIEDRWRGDEASGLWTVHGDATALRKPFAAWAAEARALIDSATDWRIWPLFERPPLDHWTTGAVTLLGDAAHPMLPFLAQGAAQAIEDAGALGDAVGREPTLAQAFAAYERARRPKADRVQHASRKQGHVYHLGGPAGLLRDAALRVIGPAGMLERYDWLYGDAVASR